MENLDVLYQKLLLMSPWWNTEHHGPFAVKIHPVEKKLHHIMMKLDPKHRKHWIYKFSNTDPIFSRQRPKRFSRLLETFLKWIFVAHTKILQYYCL